MKHNKIPESLIKVFSSHSSFSAVLNKIVSGNGPVNISGLNSSALQALFVSSLIESYALAPLIVFKDSKRAEEFVCDIESFFPANYIALLPDLSDRRDDNYSWYLLNDAFQKIVTNNSRVILSSVDSLNLTFPSFPSVNQLILSFSVGDSLSREELVRNLNSYQYRRDFSVGFPGEYALRGDIVDIYCFGGTHPYRIEFFNNSIESIRIFDKDSLQTIKKIENFSIFPVITENSDLSSDVFSYLPENSVIIFPDFDLYEDDFKKLFPDNKSFSSFPTLFLNALRSSDIHFNASAGKKPTGFADFKEYINTLKQEHKNGRFFLSCSDPGQQTRLASLLNQEPVTLFVSSLSCGFEIPEINLFVYTDTEIFSKRHRPKTFSFLPPEVKHAKFDPSEIEYDDLLVHLDYGIGKYRGLKKISAFGADRECLVISYANDDKVFVPLEKMSLVHKYRSTGNALPKISRLGSTEWNRIKMRTRRSVEELSQEIINLYSVRLRSPGFSFSPDSEFQMTLESEFPFEETADQIRAISEIKRDMESPTPMDRLLCGDVGFGKTEVAIRAAFKAVNDSKQVAILTPTTILADQHYFTFKKRLEKYPVRVERLSRFIKNSSQKNVLADLAAGKIDIIIGTHRILSRDVVFADLGLLIIDEEHRFGVTDKDKIKKYRANIDVLSLSATPIPRSLHFSLIGARDFSLISTPPKERLPIFTEIVSFDKDIIKRAVNREIDRGGQVFFVHNEIKTIASLTESLKQMFPSLVIRYAHGQMSENELEPIMLDFINNKIHILVTTAIIESGIDIPNANTIFINKAHTFGLSQLYQLRGRVGRLDRQAYAYLIVSNPSRLTTKAIRRLQSIKRHTSLGSGYLISLEDLEIRGSGNIFGLEQSGNIHAIGYDLYIKILQDSLADIKDDEREVKQLLSTPSDQEINIVFPFPAYIPEYYISSESLRLSYYKQLTSSQNLEDIESIEKIIVDIFGRYPVEMENLFSLITIRLLCSQLGIIKLKFEENICRLQFAKNNPFKDSLNLLSFLKSVASGFHLSYKFIPSQDLVFAIYLNKRQKIVSVKQFLYHLRANLNLE